MRLPILALPTRQALVPFVLLLAAASAAGSASAAGPSRQLLRPTDSASPSSYFYTTYEAFDSSLSWVTCGYDPQSSGCYGSGDLGPFGRMCSVAGSSARVVVADSNPASGVTTLYFYKQEESATPSATLERMVELPNIPASSKAQCHMSILGNFLYFGTNQSATAYQINTRTYKVAAVTVCGTVTSAITASNDSVVVSQSGCFESFDKQGSPMEDGGETTDIFVPGTNGFKPTAQ